MSFANFQVHLFMTMTLSQKFKFLDQFEEQIKTLKTVLSHVGLYVGLIAYTALGAWVSKQITIKRNVMCTLWALYCRNSLSSDAPQNRTHWQAFSPYKSDLQGVPTCLEQLRNGSERFTQQLWKIYFYAEKLLFKHFLCAAKYKIAF